MILFCAIYLQRHVVFTACHHLHSTHPHCHLFVTDLPIIVAAGILAAFAARWDQSMAELWGEGLGHRWRLSSSSHASACSEWRAKVLHCSWLGCAQSDPLLSLKQVLISSEPWTVALALPSRTSYSRVTRYHSSRYTSIRWSALDSYSTAFQHSSRHT